MLYLIYLSGFAWLPALAVLFPSVWRIWFGKPDVIDILCGPLAFIAANQVGYCLRWAIFHGTIPSMGQYELAMWSGLYALSIVSAFTCVLAWRIVRRAV